MTIDNIVGNWIFNPIDRGTKPFQSIIDYQLPSANRTFRDYVQRGASLGAKIGKGIGALTGLAAPLVGGWYLTDYAISTIPSIYGSTERAVNIAGTAATGFILLPFTLRVLSGFGAALGTAIGGTLGTVYGALKKIFG